MGPASDLDLPYGDLLSELSMLPVIPIIGSEASKANNPSRIGGEDCYGSADSFEESTTGAPLTTQGTSAAFHVQLNTYLEALSDCSAVADVDVVVAGDGTAAGWSDDGFNELCNGFGGSCINLGLEGLSSAELVLFVKEVVQSTCLAPKVWVVQAGTWDVILGSTAEALSSNLVEAVKAI
eukprot:scaffold662403_cov33-Prasinocladus_malaysianus.AAC.1